MSSKARWVTAVVVWAVVLLGAALMIWYRGDPSWRNFIQGALYASSTAAVFGIVYYIGGVTGDAFPPYTVVDLRAAQNQRGQPLDHGRSALPRFTLGVVVMAAAIPLALISFVLMRLLPR